MKRVLIVLPVLVFFFACRQKVHETITGFTYSPEGYYYHLSAFDDSHAKPAAGNMLWLEASFKTQKDSVFWDSRHDASGKFFMKLSDSLSNPVIKHLYRLAEGDSMCFYFRKDHFFPMYFKTEKMPFFSLNDSLVKAEIKLKKILKGDEIANVYKGFENTEEKEIGQFLSEIKRDVQKDSTGIIWLEHERTSDASPHYGSQLVLSYKGYFLDGKMIDNSNGNFALTYGTPDQLLKGLNFVIKGMRKGEYAKIILPSCLAYGKTGSSNGTVPPYTPLLYEIHLTEVK